MDGAKITTWQQAFQEHRIPTTRAIEKQLRSSATQDREKLRVLVGDSYRELLATAEAIVGLEAKVKVAEDHLSSISHNCRPPQQDGAHRPLPPEKTLLAQFRLLQRCHSSAATSLRTKDILQCAQLIFLSRLLLKSIEGQETLAQGLDHLRNKIGALRRQLLRQVDALLVNPTSKQPDLLSAICSYCLVTSVSSEEALAHLRQLRLDKFRRQLEESRRQATLCEALQYQLSSLQTFKALTGRPVADALNNLQRKPILADSNIRTLESLDLDRTWPLIPGEIQSFVPYFKRSAHTAEEMEDKFQAWSQEASRVFVQAIHRHLAELHDITEVLKFRRELYTVLLPVYFSTPASRDIEEHIRRPLNERLGAMLQEQGMRLGQITKTLIECTSTGTSVMLPWDPSIANAGLDGGGAKFIRQVKNRHSGLGGGMTKATRSLDAWIASVHTTQSQLHEIPKVRWRDTIEEPDDDQEDEALTLVTALSEEDPDFYNKTLHESLQKAMSEYEASIVAAASAIVDDSSNARRAVMLLRAIRISTTSLQQAFREGTQFKGLAEVASRLHEVVAKEVVRQLSQQTENDSKRTRWDKTQLPEDMPSPRAFATLSRLCKIMLALGGIDLWSSAAVDVVKRTAGIWVFDDGRKKLYMETEFDEAYLRVALQHDLREPASKASTVDKRSSPELDYWARTKLLFGVLA